MRHVIRAGAVLLCVLCLNAWAVPEADLAKIRKACPDKPSVKPQKPRKLLVFSLCRGFRHGSIPHGKEALRILGETTGAYTAVVSDDTAVFEPDALKQFDAVFINNSTGDWLRDDKDKAAEARRKKALLDFVAGGKGVAGLHGATDWAGWTAWGELIGGRFTGHPWHELVGLKLDDPQHPVLAAFGGKGFEVTDEIYQFARGFYSRDKVRTLLSLDMRKTKPKGKRSDGDYAVSWVRKHGDGRVFYCSLGHRNEIFWNPVVLQHYLDGIQFALGDLPAEAAPLPLGPRSVDPLLGEYAGAFEAGGAKAEALAKVFPLHGGYRMVLLTRRDGKDVRIELQAGAAAGRLDVYPTREEAEKKGGKRGVNFAYYEGEWNKLPDFTRLKPVKTGTLPYFDIKPRARQDKFGFRYTGFLKVPADATYTFTSASDDGSALYIGNRKVVDNDGLHAQVPKSGKLALKAGVHPITVVFFEGAGGEGLSVGGGPAAEEPESGGLAFEGEADGAEWNAVIAGDKLTAQAKKPAAGRFTLAYRERTSPTAGMKPPEGAVVLLPREKDGRPSLKEWKNRNWTRLPDGSFEVARGNNHTVRAFGDVRLHLEFMCPYEPDRRGQGRGNSGVYLQSRYEIQVLDSFGLVPRMGDCGAIYGVAIPRTNASLPPLRWQTYDVVFRAARFGPDGKVKEPPTFVSVKHNGVTIHENQPVKGATRAAGASGHTGTGPLMLQDHGNRVRYRNIWIVEDK
jgi:type 1 glutamine amidotransferase